MPNMQAWKQSVIHEIEKIRLEMESLPEPPAEKSWVETKVDATGRRMYRVVTASQWAVIPEP
jgi:hypothetical protein